MARIKSWQMCPVIHQNHMSKHPCCPPTVKRRIIPSSDYLKRACTFPVKKDHKSWTGRKLQPKVTEPRKSEMQEQV